MEFKEVSVDVPWGKVAVLVGGDERGKPVFAVHGRLDSASTFIPLVSRLPSGFRFIMVDLPGCGRSDLFPQGLPIHIFDFVIALNFVVEHFKLEKFIFLSHSVGGLMGLYLYKLCPEKFERFVSIDYVNHNPIEVDQIADYIKYFYGDFYSPDNYGKFNRLTDPPTYTYDQALELVMKSRSLTKEAGKYALERCLVPVGKDIFRLVWDQRIKRGVSPPYSVHHHGLVLATVKIPFLIIATKNTCKLVTERVLRKFEGDNPNIEGILTEVSHLWVFGYKGLIYRLSWDQRMKRLVLPPFSVEIQRLAMTSFKIPYFLIVTKDAMRRFGNKATRAVLTRLCEYNPDFELVVVDGVHDVHLVNPDLVASFVGPFLNGAKIHKRTISDMEEFFKMSKL